jgi:protein MpaA
MNWHVATTASGKLKASLPAAPTTKPSTKPGCARTIRLGLSVQGRAIVACRLRGSDDTAAHTVLVVGSIHGVEPAGLGVVARLKAMNISGRTANVWVIKTINPDGTLVKSRGNAHKIDLNRNFPAKGWKVQGAGTVYYGGRAAGSEPETQALMSAMAQLRPTEVVVFHQQLNLIDCTPYRSATLSRTLHELTGYRFLRPPSCLASWVGQFTTWANETYSTTSAVTFELEARPTAKRLDRVASAMVKLGAQLGPR